LNRSILSRVLSVLFLAYALGYGLFLLYSIVTFSGESALSAFRWEYQSRQAFVLFVDYLIAAHVSGIVIAFSFGGPTARSRAHVEPARSFSRLVSSTLATFVILSVVYTALFEAVAPSMRARLSDIEYESKLAKQFLVLAEKAKTNGNFTEASAYADLYLRIDVNNPDVLSKKQNWDTRVVTAKPASSSGGSPAPAQSAGGADATALMEKARLYFSREDYYSAHYFATQAHALEEGRTDALQLAARAMDKITSMTPSKEDTAATELFVQKKLAYDTLVKGETLAAYYAFLSLSKKYPKDKDIAEYLAQSTLKIKEKVFFIEDAEKASNLTGTQSILFINREEKDFIEAVAIGKLVQTMEGLYAMDVEAVRYTPAGSVIYHFTARYGKLEGDTLLLLAVDRAKPSIEYSPKYSAGSRTPEERNLLALVPTVSEMTALTVGRGGAPSLSLPRLWNLQGRLQGFGISGQAISAEIVMDLLMPFVFLTLSFFAMAFGWAFRARYLARPPLPLFIFAPLVPVAATLVCLLWMHAHKVLLGFVLLTAGFGAALAVCLVAELALLICSLVILSGQTAS
jgi:hypothetical protein